MDKRSFGLGVAAAAAVLTPTGAALVGGGVPEGIGVLNDTLKGMAETNLAVAENLQEIAKATGQAARASLEPEACCDPNWGNGTIQIGPEDPEPGKTETIWKGLSCGPPSRVTLFWRARATGANSIVRITALNNLNAGQTATFEGPGEESMTFTVCSNSQAIDFIATLVQGGGSLAVDYRIVDVTPEP